MRGPAALALLIPLMATVPSVSEAATCLTKPNFSGTKTSQWKYRQIGGKRCWYLANAKARRSELRRSEIRRSEPKPEPVKAQSATLTSQPEGIEGTVVAPRTIAQIAFPIGTTMADQIYNRAWSPLDYPELPGNPIIIREEPDEHWSLMFVMGGLMFIAMCFSIASFNRVQQWSFQLVPRPRMPKIEVNKDRTVIWLTQDGQRKRIT